MTRSLLLRVVFLLSCVLVSGQNESGHLVPVIFGNELHGHIKIQEKEGNVTVKLELDKKLAKPSYKLFDTLLPHSEPNNACSELASTFGIDGLDVFTEFNGEKTEIYGFTLALFDGAKVVACAPLLPPNASIFVSVVQQQRIYALALADSLLVLPVGIDAVLNASFSITTSCSNLTNAGMAQTRTRTVLSLPELTKTSTFYLHQSSDESTSKGSVCQAFQAVMPLSAWTGAHSGLRINQENPFSVPRVNHVAIGPITFADDCEGKTNSVQQIGGYLPEITLFGPESVLFKYIPSEKHCARLLPFDGLPVLVAAFSHPAAGRLFVVNLFGRLFLSTELQNVFDSAETTAIVRFSSKPASSSACLKFEPAAGLDVNTTMQGLGQYKLMSYRLQKTVATEDLKSVQVDLGWISTCANLTLLPEGAIVAHAVLHTHNIASSRRVGQVIVADYPVANRTELLKSGDAKDLDVHSRPIDYSFSTAQACSETVIGPKVNQGTASKLTKSLGSATEAHFNTPFLGQSDNVIGRTVLAHVAKNEIACGSFSVAHEQERVVMALFNDSEVVGVIKLSAVTSPLAAMLPTKLSYYLEVEAGTVAMDEPQELDWEVVSMNGGLCQTALLFDPFRVQDHQRCDTDLQFCPLGQVRKFAPSLVVNSKQFFQLPQSGLVEGAQNANLYVRLRLTGNHTICSRLHAYQSHLIHWHTSSNRSLSEVKEEVARRLGLSNFQVGVDYTRQFSGHSCSVFSISLLLQPSDAERMRSLFDIASRQFTEDPDSRCSSRHDDPSTPEVSGGSCGRTLNSVSMTLALSFLYIRILISAF